MAYNDIESQSAEKQSTNKMTADEESVWIVNKFLFFFAFLRYHKTVFPFFINVGQNKHRLVRFIKFLYTFFIQLQSFGTYKTLKCQIKERCLLILSWKNCHIQISNKFRK